MAVTRGQCREPDKRTCRRINGLLIINRDFVVILQCTLPILRPYSVARKDIVFFNAIICGVVSAILPLYVTRRAIVDVLHYLRFC